MTLEIPLLGNFPPPPLDSAHSLGDMYKDCIAALLEIAVKVSISQKKKKQGKNVNALQHRNSYINCDLSIL